MVEDLYDECVAMLAIKILGKKWTTYILCELFVEDRHFSDLQKAIEGNYGEKISSRVLSESLSRLEDLQIVERIVVSEISPIRVKYCLTDRGRDFGTVFAILKGWGIKWGGIEKYKKCRSFSCIHNTVPYIDIEEAKGLFKSASEELVL